MKQLFFRLYLLLILTFIGLGWSIDKFYNTLTNERQITSDLALHQGTFFLLSTELKRHPENERQAHLTALSTSFGYPITLTPLSNIDTISAESDIVFESAQITYLQAGGIVTLYDDIAGKSWFFKRLDNTSDVIVLGPIITESIVQSDVVYTLIFFSGLALIVFIWVWPLSKGLVALTKSATAFGKGDFSIRANEHVSAPLLTLVQRFNAMAERIQQLIKSHKELSHAVSHELRTPIARIRFAMEIIRDEEDKALVNQYIDTMDESIEELDGLVDELLVYARFDREEPQLALVNVDIIALVNEVVNRFKLTEPHLLFEVKSDQIGESKQSNCYLDKDGITRVIDNLIRNAVRYATQNIQIIMLLEGDDIVVKVDDDGEGIPQSEWHSLFEPFVRLDQSRDRKSGGIGLGLAIVKRFVELHKGSVRIDQSDLGGASFIIRWPRNGLV